VPEQLELLRACLQQERLEDVALERIRRLATGDAPCAL
jgi:hypothetical protein